MKKFLIGSAALLSLSVTSGARAADMPVYKATPPAVYDSWTGFYVGAALGGKWGYTTWTTTLLQSPPFTPIIDASSPRNYNPTSIRLGGYLGYNWQFAPQWVAGVEIDVAYANKTVTALGIPGCAINCIAPFPGPVASVSSVGMHWDASARARLGYLMSPNLLVYGTGGVALQDIQTSATCQHSAPDPLCLVLPGNPFATATNSLTHIRVGWTVGAGLDARIYGNWIARGEYRYANFGTVNEILNLSLPGAPAFVGYGLKVETHIATLGLAYKFGGPVVVKY